MASTARGVVLSTYLEPEHADLLRTRAEEADRSVAAELRRCLRFALANDERRSATSAAVQESAEQGPTDAG